jgi:hypothetical protein
MNLTYELEPNQYSLRVYDSERGDMDYVSSGMVQVHGEVGWVMQISNPTFLDCLVENAEEIMSKLGVNRLEGIMNPAMARMLRIKAKGKVKYEEIRRVLCSGRDLIWAALEPFASKAGTVKHLNLRQKEHDMSKKTYSMSLEMVNEKKEVEFDGQLNWYSLDAQRVAFIEKHLIGGLVSLNKENAEILQTLK